MPVPFPLTEAAPGEGLRERKKRETRQRIAETGLRLFLAHGFEGTTLDMVAEAAGISRRAFFSYFKSKDDILMYWQGAGWARIRADLLGISPDVPPLDAVRDVVARHMSAYSRDEMAALDRLMRSSKTLKARKQAFYAEQELALFETLCEVWRQPERRLGLRMVAVASIGALRVTTQLWGEKPVAAQPMAELFRAALDGLASELGANDAK